MYEAPELIDVGNAKDVICGVVSLGDDLDGQWFPKDFEFFEDEDEDFELR